MVLFWKTQTPVLENNSTVPFYETKRTVVSLKWCFLWFLGFFERALFWARRCVSEPGGFFSGVFLWLFLFFWNTPSWKVRFQKRNEPLCLSKKRRPRLLAKAKEKRTLGTAFFSLNRTGSCGSFQENVCFLWKRRHTHGVLVVRSSRPSSESVYFLTTFLWTRFVSEKARGSWKSAVVSENICFLTAFLLVVFFCSVLLSEEWFLLFRKKRCCSAVRWRTTTCRSAVRWRTALMVRAGFFSGVQQKNTRGSSRGFFKQANKITLFKTETSGLLYHVMWLIQKHDKYIKKNWCMLLIQWKLLESRLKSLFVR